MPAPQIDFKNESLDWWELQRIRNFWLKLFADFTVLLKPVVNYLMAFAFVAALFNIFKAFFVKIPLLTASPAHEMKSKANSDDEETTDSEIISGSQASAANLPNEKEEEKIVPKNVLKFLAQELNYLNHLLFHIQMKLREENLPLEQRVSLIILLQQIIMQRNLTTLALFIHIVNTATPENTFQPSAPTHNTLQNSFTPKPEPHFNHQRHNEKDDVFVPRKDKKIAPVPEKLVPPPAYEEELPPPPYEESTVFTSNFSLKPSAPPVEEEELPPPPYEESTVFTPTLSPKPSAPPVEEDEKEDLSAAYSKPTLQSWQLYTQMPQIQTVPVAVPVPSAPCMSI
jgi:hypothetical protein